MAEGNRKLLTSCCKQISLVSWSDCSGLIKPDRKSNHDFLPLWFASLNYAINKVTAGVTLRRLPVNVAYVTTSALACFHLPTIPRTIPASSSLCTTWLPIKPGCLLGGGAGRGATPRVSTSHAPFSPPPALSLMAPAASVSCPPDTSEQRGAVIAGKVRGQQSLSHDAPTLTLTFMFTFPLVLLIWGHKGAHQEAGDYGFQ